MSSTPTAVTPIPVSSHLSPNAPLPSSVLPSRIHSPSDTVSIPTSVSTSPTLPTITPVTTLAFSEQSQQTSSGNTTMIASSTSVADTVTLPSSSASSPLANFSSTFSSIQSSTTSSNISRSATSAIVPTTPSTSSPTAFQSSSSTSSITSLLEKTTALALPSSATTSSSTSFTTSPLLPSDSSSQSFSVGTDTPLTTVFASTTIFITSTNSQGQLITSAPPVVTEVVTTTGSSGMPITVTQVVVNPTLASNNNTQVNEESFFSDTGAVVGVFVVVGLAFASIMVWILFAIRRRQRMRRIEQDTVAEAAVTAAGLNRTPLDDDDEDDSLTSPNAHHQFSPGMGQRGRVLGPSFLPASVRLLDGPVSGNANSYPRYPTERRRSTFPEGYIPARTTSPLPGTEQCVDDLGSSRGRRSSYGHTPTYSAGSFEPLLANYARTMSDRDTSAPGAEIPQNHSLQHIGNTSAPNGYSSDSPGNGSRNSLKRQNSSDSSIFRDEEDDTRYVLTVRNVPDNQSQHSL